MDSEVKLELFDQFVLLGNSANLKCQAPSHQLAHLELVGWLKDERLLPLSKMRVEQLQASWLLVGSRHQDVQQQEAKYLLLANGAQLLIRNVTKEDAGSYKCRMRHRLSGVQATSQVPARLMVDERPSRSELRWLPNNPSAIYARENSEASICLQMQAYPPQKCTWFRESASSSSALEQVELDSGDQVHQSSECLLFSRVQLRHSGFYVCQLQADLRHRVRLQVSSSQLSAQIHTTTMQQALQNQRLPPINQQQQYQLVQLGTQVQINCSISGQPHETIAWFREGNLLAAFNIRRRARRAQPSQPSASGASELAEKLELSFVQPNVIAIDSFGPQHVGVYQCQVYSEPRSGQGIGSEPVSRSNEANQDSELERDRLRSASSSLQLELQTFEPQLVQRFQAHTMTQLGASSVSLQCTAVSVPAAKILWFLDEELINPIEQLALSDQALIQSNLLAESNQADRDRNLAMSSNPSAWDFDWQDWASNISTGDSSITDSRFKLSSIVSTQQQSSGQLQFTTASQLNISQPLGMDTGQYKCLALNSLGTNQHLGQLSVLTSGGSERLSNRLGSQIANKTILAGHSATLRCPVRGYPLGSVEWFHEEERLPRNNRQRVEPVKLGLGGQLELSNVDPELDGGLYTCRARLASNASGLHSMQKQTSSIDDQDGASLIGQAKIRVLVRLAPSIDAQSLPEVIQANEGMRTKLVCSVVEGQHPVEISWLKRVASWNGKQQVARVGPYKFRGYELMQNQPASEPIESSSRDQDLVTIHNLDDSCLLTFRHVSYLDAADYLCVAYNEFGRSVRASRLLVNVAPSWSIEPPSQLSVHLGVRLQLDCAAHGQPAPHVSWRRELEPTTGTGGSENGDISLGSPGYRHRTHSNGTLVIEQVELNDSGRYFCDVSNALGAGLSKAVSLHVNVPPYFKQRQVSQLGQLNSRAEISCLVHGEQPMIVGWRHETDVIDLMHDIRQRVISERKISGQQFESQLVIPSLTRNDSGQYFCLASNEFGTDQLQVHLLVQEPPEAPNLMRPIRTSARQATLVFRLPFAGNSPIKNYAIQYKRFEPLETPLANQTQQLALLQLQKHQLQQPNWQQTIVEAPSVLQESSDPQQQQQPKLNDNQQLVSLNLCCLQPYSRYLVRVKAINDVGTSEPSRPATLTTDEEAIGGPPLTVSVEPTGAHSLKVKWRAPAHSLRNGLIRGYYIGYRAHGGQPQSAAEMQPSSTNIKLLEPNEGEQYEYKNVQLDLGGGATRQVINSIEQLEPASWISNQSFDAGAFVSSKQLVDNTGTNEQQYFTYLTGLRRKTSYSIIMQAYSKVGAGPRSDQLIVSTLDAAPPMSPALRLVASSHNSAQLAWSTRRFGAGQGQDENSTTRHQQQLELQLADATDLQDSQDEDPQSYYLLNYRTENPSLGSAAPPTESSSHSNNNQQAGPEWQQKKIARRQVLPYVLGNLRCGSRHLAYMSAVNSLGQSEPGNSIRFTTLGAAPIAPKTSQEFLELSNQNLVVLHLSAWQNAGCLISSFVIRFKSGSQNKWAILEHQVHPTVQTVSVAGVAFYSSSSSSLQTFGQAQSSQLSINGYLEPSNLVSRFQSKPQSLGDFVLRNLQPSSTYKLVVEANSEAGSTSADYEFNTANLTSFLVGLVVNGIEAKEQFGDGSDANNNTGSQWDSQDQQQGSPSGNKFQLQHHHHYQQSPYYNVSRLSGAVWSLTGLFVLATIVMGFVTLVLGLRGFVKINKGPNCGNNKRQQQDITGNGLSSFLCWPRSSSSGRSNSSNGSSSHSSSGGTCYQMNGSDRPLDIYCSLVGSQQQQRAIKAAGEIATRNMDNFDSSTHPYGALQSRVPVFEDDKIESIIGDSISHFCQPIADTDLQLESQQVPGNQMTNSSSLFAIHGSSGEPLILGQQVDRNSRTLARKGTLPLRMDESMRASHWRAAQYAATLGKQHLPSSSSGTFQQRLPLKFNQQAAAGPMYGCVVPKSQQQAPNNQGTTCSQYQLSLQTSSAGTSGYETESPPRFQNHQEVSFVQGQQHPTTSMMNPNGPVDNYMSSNDGNKYNEDNGNYFPYPSMQFSDGNSGQANNNNLEHLPYAYPPGLGAFIPEI